MKIIIILSIVRIISPISILFYPLWGTIFCVLVDAADHSVLVLTGARKTFSLTRYEKYDKFLDLWQYMFMFLTSIGTPLFNIISFFFFIRVFGNIFFLITNNREIFLYTPNVFEALYIIYFIVLRYLQIDITQNTLMFMFIILVILILKFIQEYMVHHKGFFPFSFLYKKLGKDFFDK